MKLKSPISNYAGTLAQRAIPSTAAIRHIAVLIAIVMGIAFGPPLAHAAKTSNYEPSNRLRRDRERGNETKVELTETGKALADRYAAMLNELQTALEAQLPKIADEKKQAVVDALAAQKLAQIKLWNAQRNHWRGGHANAAQRYQSGQEKLDDGANRIADAEMLLKNALAMPDDHANKADAVEEAQKRVESIRKEQETLPQWVEKTRSGLEQAKQREPELVKQVETAAKAVEQARVHASQAVKNLGIDDLLSSDALDARLAKYTVLSQATPYWLAVYAQQGPKQQKIVEDMLANPQLMIQMLVADGPVWDKYGPAAELYRNIQDADPKAKDGLFQRLALAIALEHAVPLRLETHPVDGEEPQYAEPIQRYHSYEKAYLAGELDPAFKGFDTWSLRMVVNGTEPHEISAWGRKMLRNYRPDLITMDDEDWRYVKAVVTEINYTSKFQHMGWDRPDLQRYQNILANGGICGRRAYFGRFILRAFGVPTTARSQRGHAALVRFTPHGWVACLGGGWGAGNRSVVGYPTDRDFLASTQARQDDQSFMKVKRAQWIGRVRGEPSQLGYHSIIGARWLNEFAQKRVDEMEVPALWHSVAMIKQNENIARLKVQEREAVGEDLGEANEAALKDKIGAVEIPETERRISVDTEGSITIPAVATSNPQDNTDVILFMPGNLGGWQMHYTRYGGADRFEYAFEAPKAGKYQLSARLVTPAPKQHLFLHVNGSDERVDIALPYTIGMWDELKPVEIELKKGRNVLTFYRGHYFMRGVTIRDFTLTPVN